MHHYYSPVHLPSRKYGCPTEVTNISLHLSANQEDTLCLCLRDLWHIQPSSMKGKEQGQMHDNYLHEYLNCDANCMLTALKNFSVWFLSQRVYINIKSTPYACTETYIYDNMSVVKKVRKKEKMFPFLFHSSFNDNVWTVRCKRHDWCIMNVGFESNLHLFMLICYFPRAVRNTALYKYHNQDVRFPSQDSNCLPLKYEAWQPIKRPHHITKEDKETAAKEWELCNWNLPVSCHSLSCWVPLSLPYFPSVLFWGTSLLL